MMLTWALAVLLSFSGFGALSMAMARHHRAVLGRPPSPGRVGRLRVAGWLALGLAAALCVAGFGIGYGLVVLTAVLTMAGVTVALLLAWPDRWVPRRWTADRP